MASSTNGIQSITVGGVTQSVVNTGVGTSSVTISGLNIPVTLGASGVLVPVTVNLAGVTSQSLNSGSIVGLTVTGGQFLSGNNTTTFTANATSSAFTLVGTKPTVTVNAGGSSGLQLASQSKLGEAVIAADAGGDVLLKQIQFTLSPSGFTGIPTTATGLILANGANSTTNINNTACTAAAMVVTCPITGGFTIAKGTSITLSLLGTLSGAANTGTNKAQIAASVQSAANFQWADQLGNSGTLTGSSIYNYPTNSWVITQ
jgi:hypothetical protein